ncbi:CD48 antigen-like isoform X2 [Siphateles boraxobius]|uniref:CD48 antigen-like isoform X2 n=1 Tax=Siphateles boraxobius TaxID=180520 RepID=UPI0040645FD3
MPKKIFEAFIFFCWCLWSLSGVFGVDEVKSVSATEGESVTLNSDLTEIQTDDLIMWITVHNNYLIAIKDNYKPDFPDERFRDRLKLDEKTGSLTIMNIRTTDSGLYRVISSRSKTPLYTFNLTVYARLPVPVISHSSKKSSSNCSLVCSSVLNIQCLDDSFSCVLNNTISNQTTHLNTQLCGPCSAPSLSPGAKAGIVIVVLLVFAAAAAAGVIYYRRKISELERLK